MSKSNRTRVLSEADRLVNGDRNVDYGDPISDFRTTAEMWSAYLSRRLGAPVSLKPHDVAALMMCLKLSRISWSPEKEDNWIDLAGYAACGWDCVQEEDGAAPASKPDLSRKPRESVVNSPGKGYYWVHGEEAEIQTKGLER
ncbi:MAG: hypothetical protein EB075_15620 [Bacteroidetes bacterium]|nr:hypothetical protein [Bacteroidota bacterium]